MTASWALVNANFTIFKMKFTRLCRLKNGRDTIPLNEDIQVNENFLSDILDSSSLFRIYEF